MSIYSAMRAGVTGLQANSAAIAVIADNIANVNTVSYKRGTTDFTALVTSQGDAGNYTAAGVTTAARRLVDIQGSLEQTQSSTDLAVSGDGFFIVTEDATSVGAASGGLFTRAGSFSLDEDGLMVNAQGYYLLGLPISPTDGALDSVAPSSLAALQPIDLGNVGARAVATTQLSITANLNAEATAIDPASYTVGDLADGTLTPELERTVEIYDSLGAVRTISFAFARIDDPLVTTDDNLWVAEVFWRPSESAAPVPILSGQVGFTTSGALDPTRTTLPDTVTIPWETNDITGAADQPLEINLTGGLTQFAADSALSSATADGSPPGELVSVAVDREGVLTAQFSNGRTEALFLIPVATFLNPGGLQPEQGGAYRQTIESGLLTINTAGAGGAGAIQSNALEASNVDIGTEFTSLITTQRAYSAASRIITTANEMLEELLQVVR